MGAPCRYSTECFGLSRWNPYVYDYTVFNCRSGMHVIRASDVARSWRCMLYVGALCGCSNVYRCYWLPRWLRCLSVIYQIIMLTTNITVAAVAFASPGPGYSFAWVFNKYIVLSSYVVIALLSVVTMSQTCRGSGLLVLLPNWQSFHADNWFKNKHKIQQSAIITTVCLITIIIELVFIGISSYSTSKGKTFVTPYLFPALIDHPTIYLVYWLHVILMILAILYIYSHTLFCFMVATHCTYLLRAVREDVDDIFAVPVVDSAALEKCLHRVDGICDLIGAANGVFAIPLAFILMWTAPSIINFGFQLVERQELFVFIPSFASASLILLLTLIPPAVLAV